MQQPQPPYGQPPYGAQQPPYGAQQPPYGQPPYVAQQPTYGQPPYGAQQPPYGQPVQQQPTTYGGPPAMEPANCPPGLEYLAQVDQLIVKQKVELLEAFIGFETNNKYVVKNSMGQEVYKAKEDVDCCTRNCCGPIRPFDMSLTDGNGQEVIHLYRPLNCQSCLYPCCLQTIEVSSPPGTVVGTVDQEWSCLAPQFVVRDGSGEVALRIEGPICTYSFCGDVEFKVLTPDGETEVGKISKQWSGVLREAFTDSDNFGISFPMDLDVRVKATLLGALFLIDFMFFEKSGNQENDGIGML